MRWISVPRALCHDLIHAIPSDECHDLIPENVSNYPQ